MFFIGHRMKSVLKAKATRIPDRKTNYNTLKQYKCLIKYQSIFFLTIIEVLIGVLGCSIDRMTFSIGVNRRIKANQSVSMQTLVDWKDQLISSWPNTPFSHMKRLNKELTCLTISNWTFNTECLAIDDHCLNLTACQKNLNDGVLAGFPLFSINKSKCKHWKLLTSETSKSKTSYDCCLYMKWLCKLDKGVWTETTSGDWFHLLQLPLWPAGHP